MLLEFEKFNKIARLNRQIVVTEKIDGTNAQIAILDRSEVDQSVLDHPTVPFMSVSLNGEDYLIIAGSRNRWISSKSDNFGFARWVSTNREQLVTGLGIGRHYGEWWGSGIQRRYDLNEKRFSLFNTNRWNDSNLPDICSVVPVLYSGLFSQDAIDATLEHLRTYGSVAAPNFMRPEGIVVWHTAARTLFKVTLENDEVPKSLVK